VQEGQVAKVGEGLCIIEVEEEASNPSDALTSESSNAGATTGPPPPEERGTVTSGGQPGVSESQPAPDKPSMARRSHPLDPNSAPAPESTMLPSSELATSLKADAADVRALPAVRHFARKWGVDIASLFPGSGKDGRVEREDIERSLAIGKSVGEQLPSVATIPPFAEEDVVVELGRTRYGMWKAMEKARTSGYLSNVFSYHFILCAFSRVWKSPILGGCLSISPSLAASLTST
jgi:2-oxoisovalerate dehydrogenase E2 component (dihydrolipoyl transacylase)